MATPTDPAEEIVLSELRFGTDGIRGLVGPVINQENIARIVAGLGMYCLTPAYRARAGHPEGQLTILVGGDCRSTSDYFAHLAAAILSAMGIRVLKASGYVTTPMLAHAVLRKKAAAGVMITASHNPAEHNGIKFIPWYGGSAMPEETEAAEPFLNQAPPEIDGIAPAPIEPLNPAEEYVEKLQLLVDFPRIKAAKLKICFDPLFGAAKGYFRQIMRAWDIPAQVIHGEDDPWMGKAAPDPTEARLSELRSHITHLGFDIGLATDGDGDRFAAVDATGQYYAPFRCLAVIAHYLYTHQQATGDLVRSATTSHLLDRIAEAHGFAAQVTPVGFKYLGERLRHDPEVLMCGEENGGFTLRGHIPGKDGLLGCFLMLEVLAATGKSLAELWSEIEATYGPTYTTRFDWERTPATMALADWSHQQQTIALAGTSFSRILPDRAEFISEDGSWILIRRSGTEDLVRVYVESADEALFKKMVDEVAGWQNWKGARVA